MKSQLKYIIGVVCILLLVQNVYAGFITVSRDLPKTTEPGSDVIVNLKLEVASGGETSGVVIEEKIPDGWTASSISNEGFFDSKTGKIKWLLYGKSVKSQTVSYTGAAPSNTGEYTFSGTYTTLEESIGEIAGDEKISVEAKEVVVEEEAKEVVGEEEAKGIDMKLIIGVIAAIVVIILIVVLIKRKK